MKFLISVFLVMSLYAKVVDKLAIIVNNTPITTYDIQVTQDKMNINKNQAISYLIDNAVMQSAFKAKGIYVDDFDIDNAMKKIAQRNGMDLFDFKNYLLQKGQLSQLKENLKKQLQKDKLLDTLNIRVDEEEIKKYYEAHKLQFMLPSVISATQYSSVDKNALIESMKNPLFVNPSVEVKNITFDINKVNPKIIQFLSQVDEKSFSKIIKMDNKFVVFYVIKKGKFTEVPFKSVASKIYQQLMLKKQNQALQDFISKMRAKADIEFKK